jgi:hypothetical protein
VPLNRDCLILTAAALLLSGASHAQSVSLLDRAQRTVVAYVNKLADLHCTEDVEQVKLRPNGKTEASLKSHYDYFLLLQGNSNEFQLSESRLELGKAPTERTPLLLSNGFSTLLLIFHPYYRSSFEFTPETAEEVGGRAAMRYHFAHVVGSRTPAALALRGREYPLDLQGTAWLDTETGQPLRIDAQLLHEMSDVGLRSLRVHVEYAPANGLAGHPILPLTAEVDLETPRQHWRNLHVFRDYKLFFADATQDPNVKVHENKAETQPVPANPIKQEKH